MAWAFYCKDGPKGPWTYGISEKRKLLQSFYENELQKTGQEKFRIEKVLKRKGNNLYVKWKGFDISLKSWSDKKDLVQKRVNTFLSHLEVLEEMLTLKLIV